MSGVEVGRRMQAGGAVSRVSDHSELLRHPAWDSGGAARTCILASMVCTESFAKRTRPVYISAAMQPRDQMSIWGP